MPHPPWTSKKKNENAIFPNNLRKKTPWQKSSQKQNVSQENPSGKGVGRFQSRAQRLESFTTHKFFIDHCCLPWKLPSTVMFLQLKTENRVWFQTQSKIYHSNCFISSSRGKFVYKETIYIFRQTFYLKQIFTSLESIFVFFQWSTMHSHQFHTPPTLMYDSSSQFWSRNSPKNPQSWNSPLFNTSTDGLKISSGSVGGHKYHILGSWWCDIRFFGPQKGWAFSKCVY